MSDCEMEVDNYGYLTFDTPKSKDGCKPKFSLSFVYPNDDIPLTCSTCVPKIPDTLSNEFFESFCKPNGDGKRSLILDGKDIFLKIGLYNHHVSASDYVGRKQIKVKN